jgi:hypothetical protein
LDILINKQCSSLLLVIPASRIFVPCVQCFGFLSFKNQRFKIKDLKNGREMDGRCQEEDK